MRSFIKKIITFLIFPAFILLLLIIIHSFSPLMSDYDFDGGLKIKHEILANNNNKLKIVFIGGSNLALGIDSKKIKEEFPNYEIINYGHRFQYGLNFYIKEITPYINKGDVVVIVPEYQLILDEYFGNQQLAKLKIEKLISSDYNVNISPRDFLDYTRRSIRSTFKLREGYYNLCNHHNKKSAFNEYGDCTAHWFFDSKEINPYDDVFKTKVIDTKIIENLKDKCSKENIKLLLIPPMYEKSNYENNPNLIEINKTFWNKVGLKYKLSTNLMTLEKKYFYDSPYHLLYEGVQIKTDIITSILKNEIN